MPLIPTITFRGIAHSAAVEADIRKRFDKLVAVCPSILGCRALVEVPQRHHVYGNRYHVRLDLTVPGEEIVIAHDAGPRPRAQDPGTKKATKASEADRDRTHARVAVREAFESARRRLEDHARPRGIEKAKVPARSPHGRVVQLFPVGEYGYLEARDGHEVYFQKSSVLENAFSRLAVGSAVSFVEEQGEKGPQASTVTLLHPRRARRTAVPRVRSTA